MIIRSWLRSPALPPPLRYGDTCPRVGSPS
jgi:hypothetical protein